MKKTFLLYAFALFFLANANMAGIDIGDLPYIQQVSWYKLFFRSWNDWYLFGASTEAEGMWATKSPTGNHTGQEDLRKAFELVPKNGDVLVTMALIETIETEKKKIVDDLKNLLENFRFRMIYMYYEDEKTRHLTPVVVGLYDSNYFIKSSDWQELNLLRLLNYDPFDSANYMDYWRIGGSRPLDKRLMAVLTDDVMPMEERSKASRELAFIDPVIALHDPTVAEAMLRALDQVIATPAETTKETEWQIQGFFWDLVHLQDRRIAPAMNQRASQQIELHRRCAWALAADQLGSQDEMRKLSNEVAAGTIRLTNEAVPNTPTIALLVATLGSATCPDAHAALLALAKDIHPFHSLALNGTMAAVNQDDLNNHQVEPGWFLDSACIDLLASALDDQTPTGAVWSLEHGKLCALSKKASLQYEIPKEIPRDLWAASAVERQCDAAAWVLSNLVAGLPAYHPLLSDRERRLAQLSSRLRDYGMTARLLSERESLFVKGARHDALPLFGFAPPPLARPAISGDQKAGHAFFSIGTGARVADLPLPAKGLWHIPGAQPRTEVVLVFQAEDDARGQCHLGILAKDDVSEVDGGLVTDITALSACDYLEFIANGESRANLRDFDGAIAEFNHAIEIDTLNPAAFFQRGKAKRDKALAEKNDKEFDESIADFSRAIALDPKSAEAYELRGESKAGKRDFDGSIADYFQAKKIAPGYTMDTFGIAETYSSRGLDRQNKGDLDGAIIDYSHAIELSPENTNVYSSRAYAKKSKGDLDGANADWNIAIANYTWEIDKNPLNINAYDSRAKAKQANGDLDGAIADWTKVIEYWTNLISYRPTDPPYYPSYINRAMAKQAKGDLDGADADYTSAIEGVPDDKYIYVTRGYLRYDAQRFTDALGDFRKGTELGAKVSDTSEYSRFRIWLIRSRQGDERGATQELLSYLENRKPRVPPDWPLSVMRFLVGQLTESEFLASAKNENQKTESEHMCEVYFYSWSRHLFAGDNQMAINLFKKCIATGHKDFTEYVSALAELKILDALKK